jgi:hypothetical protein
VASGRSAKSPFVEATDGGASGNIRYKDDLQIFFIFPRLSSWICHEIRILRHELFKGNEGKNASWWKPVLAVSHF